MEIIKFKEKKVLLNIFQEVVKVYQLNKVNQQDNRKKFLEEKLVNLHQLLREMGKFYDYYYTL